MRPINLSPSFLSKVISSGYDYAVAEKLGLFPKEDTEAMEDGRLIHALIAELLGGEKAKFVVKQYDSFRTNEAKKWRDEQIYPIVTHEKMATFRKVAERAINHPKIKPYLANCKVEQIVERQIGAYTVKGVLDVLSPKCVLDWKFVTTTNFDDFAKKSLRMNYDLQSSFYDFLKERPIVLFGVIENKAPYRIKIWECDQSFLDSGANKFDKAFKILDEAKWREPTFDLMEIGTLMSWENFAG